MTSAESDSNSTKAPSKKSVARKAPGAAELVMIPFGSAVAEEDFNIRPTDMAYAKELASIIPENGGPSNITPIVVEKRGENGTTQYVIRAGHHRMLALELLKTPKSALIPAQIKHYDDVVDAVFENIVENTARKDVHPRDLAKRFYDLHHAYLGGVTEKVTLKDIAARTLMSKGTVEQLVRCETKLTDHVKEMWRKKNIAFSMVLSWCSKEPEEQEQLLQAWLEEQKELEASGRKRKKRGTGKGRGGSEDEDEGDATEKRSVAEMRGKLEAFEERAELTEKQTGMVAALKWCLGINEVLR